MKTNGIKLLEILSPDGNPANYHDYAGRIVSGSYMPLAIERIMDGPNNLPAFSFAHVGEMNGDLMYDPEVCVELAIDGKLYPFSFRNDYMGIMKEVYIFRDGRKLINVREKVDQQRFFRQWERNLKEQGFLEAAKAMKSKVVA